MNRQTVTVRRQQIAPSNPTERAVYREASIGPEGATLVLALQSDPNALQIRSSAQAAALEEISRVIRVELSEQEQLATHLGADQALESVLHGGAR